jgi:hypothetical protein
MRETEPELLGAGNGRQAPITIKVAFLGSMLGPSALFNTGYRHGANGDGKEPRSVPVLRLTYCFAALVNFSSSLHESTVRYILTLDNMVIILRDSTLKYVN